MDKLMGQPGKRHSAPKPAGKDKDFFQNNQWPTRTAHNLPTTTTTFNMDTFKKQDDLKPYFEQSYGCAAFSNVAKVGIFFVGGAYGGGDIYKFVDGKEESSGKVDLIQAFGGFVLGKLELVVYYYAWSEVHHVLSQFYYFAHIFRFL